MSNMSRKLFTTAALVCMLCLAGLVMPGTAFAERCVDNGDGTVTDNGTGLMWQKATSGPMDWNAASYAASLSMGGHSGWGLPSKEELEGLYRSPCKELMDVHRRSYWSSTSYASYTSHAWLVSFSIGYVFNDYKGISHSVRAVRAVTRAVR